MFKRLNIIKDNMITLTRYELDSFPIIKMFYQTEVKDDWESYFTKGWHLLLEDCDKENDFEWVEEVMDEFVEEFFVWHSRKVAFPMKNWWNFYQNKYLKKKYYFEEEDLSQVYQE